MGSTKARLMKTIEELEKQVKDIQSQIDKLKKPELKIEKGKWYTGVGKALYCANHDGGGGRHISSYGFSYVGEWTNSGTINLEPAHQGEWRKATNKEVEQALIKEAKRRGFKEGVRLKCLEAHHLEKLDSDKMELEFHLDGDQNLWAHSNGSWNAAIYKNGKWAEILESKVVINGEEMKVDGDIVYFGCAKFAPEDLKRWFQACEDGLSKPRTNRKIKSITLDSGVEITVEQLKEIVDNL